MARERDHLLHNSIARELAHLILKGDIPPGHTIPDVETLSETYGASRPVLREAVKILTAKGMVTSLPRVGVTVRPRSQWSLLDPDVMRWRIDIGLERHFLYDILTMRRIIEPGAAELAAQVAPDAAIEHIQVLYQRLAESLDKNQDEFIIADAHFHCGILISSGSELLSQMSQLIAIAIITVASSTAFVPGGQRAAMKVHKAVVDAISAREPDTARRHMCELVDETVRQVDQLFQDSEAEATQLLRNISADARRLLVMISRTSQAQLGPALYPDSTEPAEVIDDPDNGS